MNDISVKQGKHFETVARAIEYIRAHARQQPALSDVAAAVNLSEFHLQRLFSEWAGISPKRFLQYLTKEYARQALRESSDILSTSFDAGLSGTGRLHDLMVSCEAMTPGEIKAQGKGVVVYYGIALTPFGDALFAWTQRGVCKLAFCDGCGSTDSSVLVDDLATEWSAATLQRDEEEATRLSQRIFYPEPGKAGQAPEKLHLLLSGTNFQIKVWEALLNIGSSKIVSYSTLAKLAGSSKAQRAVGSALAANRIGYLIPCHRVIRESGDVGVYRWGSDRKAMMLAWEKAVDNTVSPAE
jgi:AraC family transcriptional regulator of adaptative response/methylated-DNA-[protein]-cysteine methyltransferase